MSTPTRLTKATSFTPPLTSMEKGTIQALNRIKDNIVDNSHSHSSITGAPYHGSSSKKNVY